MTYPVAYWCRLWQGQIEQSVALMAWWAQFLPHQNAAALSAEAEAEAAPLRADPAPRPGRPRRKPAAA